MKEEYLPHIFFPAVEYCDTAIRLLQRSQPFPPIMQLVFDPFGPMAYLTLRGDQ